MRTHPGVFVILFILYSSSAGISLFAQDAQRLAVMDFTVQSERKDYQYLGKGFTEFVAVELSDHP